MAQQVAGQDAVAAFAATCASLTLAAAVAMRMSMMAAETKADRQELGTRLAVTGAAVHAVQPTAVPQFVHAEQAVAPTADSTLGQVADAVHAVRADLGASASCFEPAAAAVVAAAGAVAAVQQPFEADPASTAPAAAVAAAEHAVGPEGPRDAAAGAQKAGCWLLDGFGQAPVVSQLAPVWGVPMAGGPNGVLGRQHVCGMRDLH